MDSSAVVRSKPISANMYLLSRNQAKVTLTAHSFGLGHQQIVVTQ